MEKTLLKLIEKARQRYDWKAYDNHFRRLCEYRYTQKTQNEPNRIDTYDSI